MGEINIANSAGRDAVVAAQSGRSSRQVRWLDGQGRQAHSVRLLKAPIDRDAAALEGRCGGLGKVSDTIIAGDPEIDTELIGKYLRDTARVYVDRQRRIVHKAQQWEVVRNPDGSQRERRPRKPAAPNVGAELPLRWSGVFRR